MEDGAGGVLARDTEAAAAGRRKRRAPGRSRGGQQDPRSRPLTLEQLLMGYILIITCQGARVAERR